jgi:flagellar FliL protein
MSGKANASGEQGEAQAPKRDLGKLMLPLFAVLNLAVVGGGAFLAFKGTLGYHSPTLREPAALEEMKRERKDAPVVGEGVKYTMPSFTVNLAGQPRRLIRVEMTFEMLDKEGFEEIVRNSPRARDEIMKILNRKTFDDVETIQGKLFLKDQIAVTLNQAMKSAVIKDIYFNEFLVQ